MTKMAKSRGKKLVGFEPGQFYYEASALLNCMAIEDVIVNFEKLRPMIAASGSTPTEP